MSQGAKMQDQIDPQIYNDLISSGGQIGAMDPQIAQQQKMADLLRKQGQVPGLIDAGRRMVAPSKMAYLGALAQQGVAGQNDRKTVDLQQQQIALRQAQVQKVLDALRGRQDPLQPYVNPDMQQYDPTQPGGAQGSV